MLLDALRSAPPGAVALVDGRRTISYGALPALIEREIEWLREGGAERHAVLADNGVPWALADLALHVGEHALGAAAGFLHAAHRWRTHSTMRVSTRS